MWELWLMLKRSFQATHAQFTPTYSSDTNMNVQNVTKRRPNQKLHHCNINNVIRLTMGVGRPEQHGICHWPHEIYHVLLNFCGYWTLNKYYYYYLSVMLNAAFCGFEYPVPV